MKTGRRRYLPGALHYYVECKKMAAYLNGNLLIAQCLSAAAYLSKTTREYVLRMMLAPLEEKTLPTE